jgi:hypothetical protein
VRSHLPVSGFAMLQWLETARRFLWLFVELGFLAVLAAILLFLILGENSGVFVTSVANNVKQFANDVPTPSLIGIGVIIAIIYLVMQRLR